MRRLAAVRRIGSVSIALAAPRQAWRFALSPPFSFGSGKDCKRCAPLRNRWSGAGAQTVLIAQQSGPKAVRLRTIRLESLELSDKSACLSNDLGLESQIMAGKPRHLWQGSIVVLAAMSLALPPALAALPRGQVGDASCRGRVCPGVLSLVVA